MLEFIAKITECASLDVFDILYSSDMIKALNKIERVQKDPVEKTSLFYSYFLYKFNSILHLEDRHIFTDYYGFKKDYINTLIDESFTINNSLDKFRSNFITKLSAKKKVFAQIFLVTKWVQYLN